jgi:hypothetical protein
MSPVVQDHSQKIHYQYQNKQDLLDPMVGAYLEDKMAGVAGRSVTEHNFMFIEFLLQQSTKDQTMRICNEMQDL